MNIFENDRVHIYALGFIEAAHAGQKRKYNGENFSEHPKRVAITINQYINGDTNLLLAALLHDTVEDCENITFEYLELFFNKEVVDLVREVTNVSKKEDGNRAIRKAIDLEHIKGCSSGAANIKLADMLDNLSSFSKEDPDFAQVYFREKAKWMPHLSFSEPNRSLFTRVEKLFIDFLGYYEYVTICWSSHGIF